MHLNYWRCVLLTWASQNLPKVILLKMTDIDAEEHISSSYAQIQSARSGSFVFSSVCHPVITRPAITIQNSPFGCVYLHTKQIPLLARSQSHGCCYQLLVFAIPSDWGQNSLFYVSSLKSQHFNDAIAEKPIRVGLYILIFHIRWLNVCIISLSH